MTPFNAIPDIIEQALVDKRLVSTGRQRFNVKSHALPFANTLGNLKSLGCCGFAVVNVIRSFLTESTWSRSLHGDILGGGPQVGPQVTEGL